MVCAGKRDRCWMLSAGRHETGVKRGRNKQAGKYKTAENAEKQASVVTARKHVFAYLAVRVGKQVNSSDRIWS